MTPQLILWIYIALLVLGGLMGFLKAKSKVSLIMSLVFAGALALVNLAILKIPNLADILLGLLILVFLMRYAKTKKVMPAGMMLVVTTATLILIHVI